MDKPEISRTKRQLHFDELSPQDFERMCLWLVEREGYLRPEHLGESGSEQGRDIIAYKPTDGGEELWYFQCKRYKQIGAATLIKEIDKYNQLVTEDSTKKPAGIVFITNASLSAYARDKIRKSCEDFGYKSVFWAHNELDMLVKKYPDIVEEFFYTASPETGLSKHRRDIFARDKKRLSVWNVPYEKNVFFTGRDKELEKLRQNLTTSSAAAVGQTQAICGLGGIGKTQLAVEYAYKYRDHYEAVLWVRADSELSISTAYSQIARLLGLPEKDANDVDEVVRAVKNWLESNEGWLLIYDNADDPCLLKKYRPSNVAGHTLVTSRAHNFDVLGVKPKELSVFSPEEAVTFLFRRTHGDRDHTNEEEAAVELSKEVGYLPLALEQAGAFISEKQARIEDYLVSYKRKRLELLNQSSPVAGDYLESVATTWALNFEQVKDQSRASAALLRISSFLAPDNIPFELVVKGRDELGHSISSALEEVEENPIVLNQVLEPLTRFSLIRLHIKRQSYSIHRIVQEVVRDSLEEQKRRLWAERAIRALEKAFPKPDYDNWHTCERLLGHVISAVKVIDELGILIAEAGRLLNDTGVYCNERAEYEVAGQILSKALEIYKKTLGEDHSHFAINIINLATTAYHQGKYTEAESLLARAIEVKGNRLDEDDIDISFGLNNLAAVYSSQGKYADAERLHEQAWHIREKAVGENHPSVAVSINNLADVYRHQGRYEEAEGLYTKAVRIYEKASSDSNPDIAAVLSNIGMLYVQQGRFQEAEQTHKKALKIREDTLGEHHPFVATDLINLAGLYRKLGRYSEAEPLYQRALKLYEKSLGTNHTVYATAISNFAFLYQDQGKYADAEQLLKQALEVYERAFGAKHPGVASISNCLSSLYLDLAMYAEAEELLKRSLSIVQDTFGEDHPAVAVRLTNLAELYRRQGKYEEVEPLIARALKIEEKILVADHPDIATSLNILASMYYEQGKYEKAEPLYKRALAIRDKALGNSHPYTGTILNNLAGLYLKQMKYAEAEPLLNRSLAIDEKVLGGNHPSVARGLSNLAGLYYMQRRYTEAEPLYKRALIIKEKVFGKDHPGVAEVMEDYSCLLRELNRESEADSLLAQAKAIRAKQARKRSSS